MYCETHKRPMINGRFGWYCPTKVNGYWCKGETQAEQDELRQAYEDEARDDAAHDAADDAPVSQQACDDLLARLDKAIGIGREKGRR